MLTGDKVILLLKIAVIAVTVLLLISLLVLARGKQRLHGRINIVFFILTLVTLIGFELLIRVIQPELFNYFKDDEDLNRSLNIHLCFAIPSAVLMPFMLWTGLTRRRKLHLTFAWIFGALWIGTFVTGVFTLPHTRQ